MSRHFELRDCQKPMVNLMLNRTRGNIFASPGTGKTSGTLYGLTTLDLLGHEVFPVLIVAPLRVANVVWESEIAEWDQFKHLKLAKIIGSEKNRKAALSSKADIYVINFENLSWLHVATKDNWFFNTVIVDESTRIKNHRVSLRNTRTGGKALYVSGAKNASSLVRHCKDTKRWYNLTGTPTPNGIQDMWGQQFPIDMGMALGMSYNVFCQRWFHPAFGSNPMYQKLELNAGGFEDITDRVSKNSVVIDAYNYFDITKPIEIDVKIKLPGAADKVYKEMYNESLVELREFLSKHKNDTSVTAVNAGSKMMKCRQIASGHLRDDDGNWHSLHDEKLNALAEIRESVNAPLLVAYYFKEDLKAILERFPDAVELPTGAKQMEIQKQWNEGKIPMLCVSPQSAGHGLSLQHGGNNLVFYTLDWNAEYYDQVIERIGPTRQAQSGYERMVYIHRIIAKDTWEEVVADRLKRKISISQAIKEAIGEKK